MRSFGFEQEEFSMHEESWSFESEEHYSNGSSMQMMHRPCPPKQSRHQIMFNNGNNFMQQQDMFHGQKMHQNGWNGQFNHASGGRKKPVSCMNETQFLENGMFHNASTEAQFRTGGFGKVHTPAKAMSFEEMRYEHSNWVGIDSGHCQSYENNFNWRTNGCRNF